jgi:hypothetical protein
MFSPSRVRENVSNDITLESSRLGTGVRGWGPSNDFGVGSDPQSAGDDVGLVMNGVSMSDDVSQVVEYHNPEARQIG